MPAAAAKRWFWVALAATLVFRLWFAGRLPITGDEAYFAFWGEVPDWGFYDHPPMVGWLLAALLKVSHATWWVRLPEILLPGIIALVMVRLVVSTLPPLPSPLPPGERELNVAIAYLTGLAYLLVPTQVLNVAITTDTPLLFWSFLSIAAFLTAVRRDSLAWFALAGAALGLAFLSKYFAALLGFAYVVYVLASPAWARRWLALAVVVLAAAPFALLNFWWNYEHCWANVMFNLYNRHGSAALSVRTPLLFAALALYVTSPVLLVQLARARDRVARSWRAPPVRFLWVAAAAPFAVFAVLSLAKSIGIHWLFSFVPPLFLAAAHVLSERQMLASAKFLAVFSGLHVIAVAVALALPIETFAKLRTYDGIVMTLRADELLAKLKPYEGDFVMAAEGYSPAVTLGYNAAAAGLKAALPGMGVPPHYFLVFGPASSHARHDDLLTDFRMLAGRNILVVRKTAPEPTQYAPYFEAVEYRSFELHGATFHLILGRGFNYAAYRGGILAAMRDQYYRIPAWLPQGHCWFCERYFETHTCPVR